MIKKLRGINEDRDYHHWERNIIRNVGEIDSIRYLLFHATTILTTRISKSKNNSTLSKIILFAVN